ncbi:MAG: hypothetical protein AUJ12_00535 [Alphaproteobacteria bacterium CG1_02_46_17]|nr:MAG: hypothetical protein AUJ12_00535 [Alphaproteobacteria bacterium CG1_02_46_17]
MLFQTPCSLSRSLLFLALAISLMVLSGCSLLTMSSDQTQKKAELKLSPASFSDLKGWKTDSLVDSITALSASCKKIKAVDANKKMGVDARMGTYRDWQNICTNLPDTNLSDSNRLHDFFEHWFIPYHMSGNDYPEGLFTGYYEPTLYGSLIKTSEYNIPLRSRPQDLVMVNLGEFRDELKGQRIAGRVRDGHLKPYEDRAAIEDGKLPVQSDVPLLWVKNAVDAFFLQIQGSGVVILPDGSAVRVGYDGQNGHVYTAIGKELINRGVLTKENVSMQTIRQWLEAHPQEGRDVMRTNKSYVFFRQLDTDGPVGAQGVVLTAERSLAIDPVFIPYGVPIFIDVENPEASAGNIRSLVIAQDTGGAIKGPVRGDLFWGYGDQAAHMAGLMKSKGQAWILLPREVQR